MAKTLEELQQIPNAAQPTPGQGLVLDLNGKLPASVLPSAWVTGDYKVSAAAADHADPGGGQWLLCDGTAIAAAYTGLIGVVGANRPDARGRSLVMKGTNAAVNALLASDGVAVASRRPQHRHTAHTHSYAGLDGATGALFGAGSIPGTPDTLTTGSTDGGSGVATDALDAPAFIVPGNLFIHT